jgi:hypothetical protein
MRVARVTSIVSAIVLALCGRALGAQVTWDDGMCQNTVTFDAARVDEEALTNTVHLLFGEMFRRSQLRLPFTDVFMFTPEQAARADLPALQRECAEITRNGRDVKLLALPGIEEYRAALLDATRDVCEFRSAKFRGVKDAAALRDYKPAAQACSGFIDALEGKVDFDRAWRETIEASCQRNAQPDVCRNRHFGEAQKPDGPARQRLFMLGFGWNNCAVQYMSVNVHSKERTAQRMALEDSFKSRFRIRRSDCQH